VMSCKKETQKRGRISFGRNGIESGALASKRKRPGTKTSSAWEGLPAGRCVRGGDPPPKKKKGKERGKKHELI